MIKAAAKRIFLKRAAVFVFLLALSYRLIFFVTYPLSLAVDGANYYELYQSGESHLLFATGYPFLMWSLHRILPFISLYEMQILLSAGSVGIFFRLTRERLGMKLAAIVSLLFAFNYFSAAEVTTAHPEFLLETLTIILLGLLIAAYERPHRKTFYVGAACVFAIGYLVKYNFIAIFPLFVLFLGDRGFSMGQRLRYLAAMVGSAVAIIALYVIGFHHPSTGSWALNLEHGWIHSTKLAMAEIPVRSEYGENSRRFLFLTETLPKEKECCGLIWKKLDAVPAAEREPYLKYRDFSVLDQSLNSAALTSSSEKNLSFHRLYYYLGLVESEKIIRGAFWESVARNRSQYLRNVAQEASLIFDLNSLLKMRLPKFTELPVLFPRIENHAPEYGVLKTKFSGIMDVLSHLLVKEDVSYPVDGSSVRPALAAILELSAWPSIVVINLYWIAVVILIFALVIGRARGLEVFTAFESLLIYSGALTVFSGALFSGLLYMLRPKELSPLEPIFILTVSFLILRLTESFGNTRLKLVVCEEIR